MADSEPQGETPAEAPAANEEAPDPQTTAEAPPPVEEPAQAEPPPEEMQEPPVKQEEQKPPEAEEEQVKVEEIEAAQPAEEAVEERPKRGSKRASINDGRQKMSVDQETFVPPSAKKVGSGTLSDKRASLQGGREKRASTATGPERMPSLSSGRKSKFSGLTSKARMVVGSIVDIKTNAAEMYDKKTAKFQNTYKLESENPFNPEKVDKILKEVMNEVLENLQYDPEKCASTAKHASMQIRAKVKQLDFDRYKLVCLVSIGEKNSQDVYVTCRFLWDSEKDRYSFYTLENTHVYAIAYCFGLYYE